MPVGCPDAGVRRAQQRRQAQRLDQRGHQVTGLPTANDRQILNRVAGSHPAGGTITGQSRWRCRGSDGLHGRHGRHGGAAQCPTSRPAEFLFRITAGDKAGRAGPAPPCWRPAAGIGRTGGPRWRTTKLLPSGRGSSREMEQAVRMVRWSVVTRAATSFMSARRSRETMGQGVWDSWRRWL